MPLDGEAARALLALGRYRSDDRQVIVRRLDDRHHQTFGRYLGHCQICSHTSRPEPKEGRTREYLDARPMRFLPDVDSALAFLDRHDHSADPPPSTQ